MRARAPPPRTRPLRSVTARKQAGRARRSSIQHDITSWTGASSHELAVCSALPTSQHPCGIRLQLSAPPACRPRYFFSPHPERRAAAFWGITGVRFSSPDFSGSAWMWQRRKRRLCRASERGTDDWCRARERWKRGGRGERSWFSSRSACSAACCCSSRGFPTSGRIQVRTRSEFRDAGNGRLNASPFVSHVSALKQSRLREKPTMMEKANQNVVYSERTALNKHWMLQFREEKLNSNVKKCNIFNRKVTWCGLKAEVKWGLNASSSWSSWAKGSRSGVQDAELESGCRNHANHNLEHPEGISSVQGNTSYITKKKKSSITLKKSLVDSLRTKAILFNILLKMIPIQFLPSLML